VSNVWTPWDPEGSRFREPSQEQGPDPEPIVRTVRIGFLLAGMLVAVMVNAALHSAALAGTSPNLAVTGTVAAIVLVVLALAAWAFRPARLLLVGKRALHTPDRRELQPRAERARAMGFRGLAMTWATQAMVLCFLPAVAGLVLDLAHGVDWELLGFAGMSLLAGIVFQYQVAGAVRRAVDDPELRARYGPQ
jgi:hypothetical protein